MTMPIQADHTIDAQGLACPMPIVRTKKAMDQLKPGQVLEVQVTDKGSLADLQAWAKSQHHDYLGVHESGAVFYHFIRKKMRSHKPEFSRPTGK